MTIRVFVDANIYIGDAAILPRHPGLRKVDPVRCRVPADESFGVRNLLRHFQFSAKLDDGNERRIDCRPAFHLSRHKRRRQKRFLLKGIGGDDTQSGRQAPRKSPWPPRFNPKKLIVNLGDAERLWAGCGCLHLHSNYMLNRGYAYATIISSKYHGQALLSHLAALYPHSTLQAWQQKLNNGEVTLNGGSRHWKRIGQVGPNTCLEPATMDGTGRPSALRSAV